MCKIVLDRGSSLNFTSVSNLFIDNYMIDANGEFVKIYLYLLRTVNSASSELESLSTEAIADRFSLMESDVYRALDYWEQKGLLNLTYNNEGKLSGIVLGHATNTAITTGKILHQDAYIDNQVYAKASGESFPAVQTTSVATTITVPKKSSYTPTQMLKFKENEAVGDLIIMAEAVLGRTLNPTDLNCIIYMYNDLQLHTDYIEFLITKSIDEGIKSLPTIEKEAVSLYKRGITSKNDYKLDELIRGKIFAAIYNVFGFKTETPAKHDVDLVRKWVGEFSYNEDMIIEACHRTMAQIHKGNFQYADRILTNWFNSDAKTLDDVKVLDLEHSKRQEERFKTVVSSKKTVAKKPKIQNHKYDFDAIKKRNNKGI